MPYLFLNLTIYTKSLSMPKPKKIEAQKLIGLKVPIWKSSTTDKQAILYALGIGFSRDPLKEEDYKYTNEFNQDFTAFPTIGVTLPQGDLLSPLLNSQHMPQFSPFVILHAEHKLTIAKQKIQIGVEYQHDLTLIDCADKGKNAFILFKCDSYYHNQKGQRQLGFTNQTTMFLRGLGGFNYQGKGFIKPAVQIPQRHPDYKLTAQTFPGQAFLYRLCADINPLHIDPNIAKAQNFQRPILHGLASYGTVARVFVQEVLKNDPTRLKCIQTRFVGHVYPGQTLDVSVWRTDDTTYLYEAQVRGRHTKVVVGYIQVKPTAKL